MKPKSFNRDMKRELAGTLAAHGVAAVIACAAAAGAWDYAVSVNIIFTISTNAFSPIAPTRIRRIRQRGCAAFGA